MIISKCVDIKSTNGSDAMGEYFITALNDASSTLKINNNPVFELRPNMCNLTLDGIIRFNKSSSDTLSGNHVSFFQFINDFASLDCGILHNDQFISLGRYIDGNINNNKFKLYHLDTGNDVCCTYLYVTKNNKTPQFLKHVPYYMYNGPDTAYIGFGTPTQCIVFAKLKSIDNPSNFKYVVIVVGETQYENRGEEGILGSYDCIKIITNSSLMTNSYTNYINRKLNNINKSIIEKFIIDGYYSDELFLFDGLCPCGLFNINDNTYLNLGYNLYLKITN